MGIENIRGIDNSIKSDKINKKGDNNMTKPNINNAQHSSRQTAIHILEDIANYMGNKKLFDCKAGDVKWFDLEDMLTTLIEEVRAEDKDKITRRNKQIKGLKETVTELEIYQEEVDHFLIKRFDTSNLAELDKQTRF